MNFQNKMKYTFEERLAESTKLRTKYPLRIPVIVEKVLNSPVPDIEQSKFLVPSHITTSQFIWVIRTRIQLPADKALFVFVGKVLPQPCSTVGELYEDLKDEDGFLYVAYSAENTFGR